MNPQLVTLKVSYQYLARLLRYGPTSEYSDFYQEPLILNGHTLKMLMVLDQVLAGQGHPKHHE